MTKPAPTTLDLYFKVLRLARFHKNQTKGGRCGLGHEDIRVRLKLPADPETVDWVKRIVLGNGHIRVEAS